MQEINNYELAANKFFSKLAIKSLPIKSWDFYATFFDAMCHSSKVIFMLKNLAKKNKWSYLENFNYAILQKKHVIVVTDSNLRIVHVTQNIFQMNGYRPEEILGKKPKMFQGANTCKETSRRIGLAVKNKEPFETIILNYRKDGTSYKCWIKGEPIVNNSGEVINFIAYEKEVA